MQDDNPNSELRRKQTDGPLNAAPKPFFSAVLTPYRSLSPKGFLLFMACLGLVSFVAGLLFLSIGAWPVFGFFGLDVLLIWGAFKLNYAAARAYEEVEVSVSEIVIRRVGPGKRHQELRFNPVWVRLDITRLQDEGVVRIALSSRGETIDLGGFLNPEDRTSFAGAFAEAVSVAKAGGVQV